MHAQDLVLDDCGDWHPVEAIDEGLPELHVISAFAWIDDGVHSS